MKRVIQENPNTIIHWNEVYGKTGYPVGVDDLKFKYIAQHIINESSVCDLGCGNGDLLITIDEKNPNCELTGVDFSDLMINSDKERLTKPNFNFICSDVTATPLDDNQFDYVTCLETLEHVEKPQDLVREIYRILKPGGLAFLTTPYEDHIPSQEHIWQFNYKDVRDMFLEFSKVAVFPYASGRQANFSDGRHYPSGNLDEIFVIAKK